MVIHFANVLLSSVMGSESSDHDECSWYFMAVLLDSTLGLVLLYYLLRISARYISRKQLVDLYSGDYGDPPQCKVRLSPPLCLSLCVPVGVCAQLPPAHSVSVP